MPDTPEGTEAPGTPRWVKVLAIIALVVVVLVVVLLATGRGGSHGPGRHLAGGDDSPDHSGPPLVVTQRYP
jgi:hypothetical protein